jgi:hypothetical protein
MQNSEKTMIGRTMITTEDITSPSKPITYAKKGEIVTVVAEHGEIFIVKGADGTFVAHASKLLETIQGNQQKLF